MKLLHLGALLASAVTLQVASAHSYLCDNPHPRSPQCERDRGGMCIFMQCEVLEMPGIHS